MLLANVIFVGVYLCSTVVGCEWLCLECDFSGFCHHRWNFDGINVLIAMHTLICTSTNMYGIYPLAYKWKQTQNLQCEWNVKFDAHAVRIRCSFQLSKTNSELHFLIMCVWLWDAWLGGWALSTCRCIRSR